MPGKTPQNLSALYVRIIYMDQMQGHYSCGEVLNGTERALYEAYYHSLNTTRGELLRGH